MDRLINQYIAQIEPTTAQPPTSFFFENLSIAIFFTFLALILFSVARSKGFFTLIKFEGPKVTSSDLLYCFGIFLVVFILLVPLLWQILSLSETISENRPLLIALVQLFVFILTAIGIGIYHLFRDLNVMKRIWKDDSYPENKSIYQDLGYAIITLGISIPAIISISQIAELITVLLFGISNEEQLAIKYLKLAFSSDFTIYIAIFSVLIGAPFLEEYLFRGILQSFLRRKFGSIKALTISALAFSLFHFSPSQGTMNIPLICSLFIFALFIGVLYEKRRSLFATIFLHMTFNSLSVIRLLISEV